MITAGCAGERSRDSSRFGVWSVAGCDQVLRYGGSPISVLGSCGQVTSLGPLPLQSVLCIADLTFV